MSAPITNARLRRLRPRGRTYEVTCSKLPGFVVRVLPSGKKVFVVRHRRAGKDTRTRLGLWEKDLSLEAARQEAMRILARGGADAVDIVELPPVVRRARSRERRASGGEHVKPSAAPADPRPPVEELVERFLSDYVDVYLKPATRGNYRRLLYQYVVPAFGDRPFDEISRKDVRALQTELRPRGTVADYVVCVIGSLYTRIIDDWELSDMRNPTAGIKRRRPRRIERFLSPDERHAVLDELDRGLKISRSKRGSLDPASVWAIKLLMLTGQRRGEIIGLRWEMVDWQHACLHFPDTKTGQRSAPISREAVALLREIHDQAGNPRTGLVLPGRRGTKLSRINTTWDRVRQAVGIPDVRLHDLRHSFASDALMAGVPLAIVGELLGHKQASTTERYAHLADGVVREALEQATSRMVRRRPKPAPKRFRPLTDAQWKRVAERIGANQRRGGTPVDLRGVVDGIRWVLHNEAKWREVPAEYGAPTTCWRWYTRWKKSGVWARVDEVVRRRAARRTDPR